MYYKGTKANIEMWTSKLVSSCNNLIRGKKLLVDHFCSSTPHETFLSSFRLFCSILSRYDNLHGGRVEIKNRTTFYKKKKKEKVSQGKICKSVMYKYYLKSWALWREINFFVGYFFSDLNFFRGCRKIILI